MAFLLQHSDIKHAFCKKRTPEASSFPVREKRIRASAGNQDAVSAAYAIPCRQVRFFTDIFLPFALTRKRLPDIGSKKNPPSTARNDHEQTPVSAYPAPARHAHAGGGLVSARRGGRSRLPRRPGLIDQVVPGGRDLPLLVEAQPRLPQVRELSRKDGQEQPAVFRPVQLCLAPPLVATDTGRPSTDCVPPRPSWRGLVTFPLPPPSC